MNSKSPSILVLIATIIVAFIRVINSDEDIILHWDLSGDVTDTGPVYLIVLLPIIAIVVYFCVMSCAKAPYKTLRVPKVKESDSNTRLLLQCINTCNLFIMLLFFYVTLCSAKYMVLHQLVIATLLLTILLTYIYFYNKLEKK